MCFNLFNLCLSPSSSTVSTSNSPASSNTKNPLHFKSSSVKNKFKNSKKFLSKYTQENKSLHNILTNETNDLRLINDEEKKVIGDEIKISHPANKFQNLKFFKKLSKSNSSFDGAQNLTYKFFHSKSNANYFSLDLDKNFESINTPAINSESKKFFKQRSQNFFSLNNIISSIKINSTEENTISDQSLNRFIPLNDKNQESSLNKNFFDLNLNNNIKDQISVLSSSSASSSTLSSTNFITGLHKNFEFVNEPKMDQDDFKYSFNPANNNPNINPNKNFIFTTPKIPISSLSPLNPNRMMLANSNDNSRFVQESNFKNRPTMNFFNKEELPTKKLAFTFNRDQLFAKPNELLRDTNDELSSALDEELNKSGDITDHSNHFNREHSHRSSNHSHHNSSQHKHHSHHSKHKSRGGKLSISKGQVYEFKESDLKDIGQIGNGEFGTVHKVLHMPSQTSMALKRIGPTVGNQVERKKVLKELDFVLECNENPYVVKFYGVKFNNEPADCLICMELMDTSLEKFYKYIYDVKKEEIPEAILGKIVVATLNALNYLKEEHQIIHRDVKPSNILVNRHGQVKMCDFGISGKLVDSIAASRDAGCQLYMAPERIDPARSCASGYDVRSDIWSLGISLYELSTGKFPYPQWKTIFHQLNLVVDSDAPRLESERLSKEYKDFVNTCLTKDEKKRPKYKVLLQLPLVEFHTNNPVDMRLYFEPYICEMESRDSAK